ncbi:N-acetyl-alpha-D-glucosaminyl L-malate synthase BshA [Candidatus Palauibacter sp.]|uniref:N-acetyl-alpha-D-glucosaminyl L-malate synthase BshA n=1 Tax=Candidatus Palauibacter sp. TaxID=3101350 RepID=UPI003B01A5E8
MKIGITCYPTYGGSGAVATELGLGLARRGHEVHFISYAQPFRLTTFIDGVYFHEVEVNRYPLFEYPPYSLALAVTMHEVTWREELDLLHVHYAIPHATAGWIARDMLRAAGRDVKLVTTLHGTDITLVGQDPSYRSITRFSIEKSDRLTAVSGWLRDRTHRDFECDRCAIEVIPNFVDPDIYDRERYRGRHRLARPGEKVVMHISNFRAVKRIPDLIEMFARIQRELPARLVLVGDGPERQRAEDLAAHLGISGRVVFLGKLDSVADLLAHADLFLLPSEQEAFGLVALEAQASGVPVVGTSGTGLDEVIEEGVTGHLHPVGDVAAMARSAISLLADGTLWAEYSRAARRRALEHFAMERIIPSYEALYRDVLEDAGSSGVSAA